MKASLSTMWAMGNYPRLGEFIEMSARLGFAQVELNHQVTSAMLAGLDLEHAPISSIHEPCPADIRPDILKARDWLISAEDEEARQQGVRAIERSIEFAGLLGVKTIVIHPGSVYSNWPREKELYDLYRNGQAHTQQYAELKACLIEERAARASARLDAVKQSLADLLEFAQPFGVVLGLENRYHYMEIPSLDEMDLLLSLAEPERLGFWYDVGHAHALDCLGFYPHEAWLERYADRIVGVHLHDAVGINDHAAPGEGEVDFDRIAAYLPAGAIRTLELKASASPIQLKNALQFLITKGCLQL